MKKRRVVQLDDTVPTNLPDRQEYLDAISDLASNFPERESVAHGLVLALLSGAHVFILGPPGTAKSMMVESLPSVCKGQARSWSYLMTKFTEPNEIFGPYNYNELLKGVYQRNTAGYLPEADFVFLDEIFKANSAILNSLLMALDGRRRLQFGAETIDLPMSLCVGASNELPQGEELAALYDRFLLRFFVGYIQRPDTFKNLLKVMSKNAGMVFRETIDFSKLPDVRKLIQKTPIHESAIEAMAALRNKMKELKLHVSDRRWIQSMACLKAQAWLDGDTEVLPNHLIVFKNILWTTPENISTVNTEVTAICDPIGSTLLGIMKVANEVYKKVESVANVSKTDAIAVLQELDNILIPLGKAEEKSFSTRDKEKVKKTNDYIMAMKEEVGRRAFGLSSNKQASKPLWVLKSEIEEYGNG